MNEAISKDSSQSTLAAARVGTIAGQAAGDTTKSKTGISLAAAQVSLGTAAAFVVLLAALHFIKPEFDPSWRMISEYEIGANGWIMSFAFLSLALSCAALFIAVRSQVRTLGGKIGLALLLVSALGMAIGGIFTTDPITAKSDELTTNGSLHGVGFLLGNPAFLFASALISWSLTRNAAWSGAKRSIAWAAVLVWAGLVVFALAMVIFLPGSAGFGPEVPIGWPNRFLILTYAVWLIVVAWRAAQLRGQES
jgi:hypothetical protein